MQYGKSTVYKGHYELDLCILSDKGLITVLADSPDQTPARL